MNLQGCLTHLDEAIAAASVLGLDATAATSVRETARTRLGFPSDAYVLALAGGTGVGKSTLLNAIAGQQVSAASSKRPTTAEPVAWVPADRRRDLSALLTWLGVTEVREHRATSLGSLAVVDLPDFDSIAPEHRARVDELLPRVDAVAWVVDPEKYKDEIMHGGYLRTFGPRLRQQLVVLNRSDLLTPEDRTRVSDDMRAQLRREGLGDIDIAITRAREGTEGVAEFRGWLDSGVEAKRVIASRIAAEGQDAVRELAARAGVADGEVTPLIDPQRRERALAAVTRGVLALVDIPGLERQAVAATRLAARPRGAGPFGHVTSAIYRLSGRARASASPAAYLRNWQQRGSLAPAVEPLRELIAATLPTVPASVRGALATLSTPAVVEQRLADTVDRSLSTEATEFRVPTSWIWSVIGLGNYLVTAVLIFCALWFGALFLIDNAPVGSVEVPYLGAMPTPVVLLAATLVIGFLLAQALRLHAGWLGRRWARRIRDRTTREVRERIDDSLLLPIERFDSAREQLASAARGSAVDCVSAAT
ncbi:MAG TPA: GTPase [Candidatus Limnocylindria bacterium]|nr:GTPase [Candidatus Limnocylindria bacterium]